MKRTVVSIVSCAYLALCASGAQAQPLRGAAPTAEQAPLVSLPYAAAFLDAAAHNQALAAARTAKARTLTRTITRAEDRAVYYLRVMHLHALAPPKTRALQGMQTEPGNLQTLASRWTARLHALRVRFTHPPHLTQFRCIQSYETAPPFPGWRTNSGNGYYGGLQMDRTFQQGYGAWLYQHKGTAQHWSALEQIWTSEQAYLSRGYHPWPNTARDCGLL